MMFYIRCVYYYCLIIWLSLKAMPRLNLGDAVIYNGKQYTLNQGVMNPRWSLAGNGEYLENIHRDNFTKVVSIKNYLNSFKMSHRFYMTCWYGLWCRGGIKDWMRGCNIWKDDR